MTVNQLIKLMDVLLELGLTYEQIHYVFKRLT